MGDEDPVAEQDRNRYAGQMERIKLRIGEALRLIDEIPDERSLVYAAAQLRLALEEIAFASLVGNRRAMEGAERSVALNGWDKAIKSLRDINPGYWPRGVTEVRGDTETEWLNVTGGLAEPDVAKTWGRLSRLLHARNPWHEAPNLKDEKKFIKGLVGQLRITLSSHLITLVGGHQLLFCQVWSQPVRVYLFSRVEDEEPTSARS